jgi:hypothetical protein
MTFGCKPYGQAQRTLSGGRWWLPPSPGHCESCESVFARGSSVHQKCYNYALTNLLFGLCKSVWIIDPLVTHPSPHPEAPTCPSTLEVLQAKKRTPTPYPSIVFHLWTCNWVYQGVWGCVITCTYIEINFVVMFGTLFIFGGLTFASYTHTIDALIRNYQIIAHFQLFTSTNQELFF